MTKGLGKVQSKIEKHGLEPMILELQALGKNYPAIIKEVKAQRNIDISKSALTRFFHHSDTIAKRTKDLEVAVQEYRISIPKRIHEMMQKVRNVTRDIHRVLDESSLKPVERRRVKEEVETSLKELNVEYARLERETISLVTAMNYNRQVVDRFLIDMSNELCNRCQDNIRNLIKQFERDNPS